jgi:cysteine desulfurase family protein (TIGR01976 family)
MIELDIDALRSQFPGLAIEQDGRPVALFDGPGGTQVPAAVIDAVAAYYRESNANHDGAFLTSRRSDALVEEAHAALADLVNASSSAEIKLGPNMTSLTFHVSRSIAAMFSAGDEIVITTLDHEANRAPWLTAAADRGLTVHSVDIDPADCTLDLAGLDRLLGPRTRLVAVGYASNAVGTINPVREIVARAHEVGAWTYVDAVHWAPHGPVDVQELDTDFLACSVYKFFGPHVGVLYGREDLLETLPAYMVRPASDRFETGTGNFEGYAGSLAAVEYLAGIGRAVSGAGEAPGAIVDRRTAIHAAMSAIRAHEMPLFERLVEGLGRIRGARLWGIADRSRFGERTPTAAVTFEGHHPRAVAEALGARGIAVWDGDFYATSLIERLGLAETGGVVRIGLVHYNTASEVDRLLEALEEIVGSRAPVSAGA